MTSINAPLIRKHANVRPEDTGQYGDERQVSELGSRVTTKQVQVVAEKITPARQRKLSEGDELLQALRVYADTGDKSELSSEQETELKALVAACREHVDSESQARRFWPRKVAAIVTLLAQPPSEEPESDDEDEEQDS